MNGFFSREEQAVYALISRSDGLKAREIAARTGMDRTEISRLLVKSALMREMCYQDREYKWHALIRQSFPHEGLYSYSGWYGQVSEFMRAGEKEWLTELESGCRRIGRNLNDTRGLIHSFLDCRQTMRGLFSDLEEIGLSGYPEWELAFELRLNRARYIRVYADVLLITGGHAFTLEFKMKKEPDPAEVIQAAKYVPYLEILLGRQVEVIPALVLTGTREIFRFVPIGETEGVLAVSSGDMLFNVLNEYLGFLRE